MKEINFLKENLWMAKQAQTADASGLAIVVCDGEGRVVSMSNNNSMCRRLYASPEFAPACEQFCGKAFDWANKADGKIIAYRCHAGLDCRAVSLDIEDKDETAPPPPRLVAIVGRAFTKAENYRAATRRAIDGDWTQFPPTDFFANVLLSGSENNLEAVAEKLKNASGEEKSALAKIVVREGGESFECESLDALRESRTQHKGETIGEPKTQDETPISNNRETSEKEASLSITEAMQSNEDAERSENIKSDEISKLAQRSVVVAATASAHRSFDKIAARRGAATEGEDIGAWRSLFGSLLNITYKQACVSVLQFLCERYDLQSLAWLERRENNFETVAASGDLRDRQAHFDIAADDARLAAAAQRGGALELQERPDAENGAENDFQSRQMVRLFPVAVGGEIRSALVSGDGNNDGGSHSATRHLVRFCRAIAPELEILRLREEVARRGWLEGAVRRFNENLQKIDSEDFWLNLTQTSAELMKSERGSLLIFDEKSDSLVAKAAIGITADQIRNERETLGARVASKVFDEGVPVVVRDIEKIDVQAAPSDWKYKSKSFISYPIEIGGRKIGVLNLTERADGGVYNELDLDLLRAIVPQLAVLIDRAALQRKAGEFEQLSVTDVLTGLLNRRYLEERLTEEVKRSNRQGFSMSFMMIDVDEFKSYNDNFSHPEGDKALKLVAQCLKATLRDADIASRYGGEEFSILLPQTTAEEAAVIAERVREQVDRAQFPNRKVTVSIGVASCAQIDRCTASGIVKAADAALYEAKRRGRNNVRNYGNLKEN